MDYVSRGLSSPQLGALLALSTALTLGVGLILWALRPGYVPVFDHIGQQDATQIVEQLRADNIPFEIQAATGQVLVPQDQLQSIRMKLAATGIPNSTSVGLELLQQEQSLGTSQFMETTRYQHALETELSRTVSSMRNIDTARVHLAIPKQSVFVRNRARASASVMVKLFPGRMLESGQVDAIVNLVASSIPYLEASQVTVVDQWGKLFSSREDGSGAGETRKQFEYSRQLENVYAKRIETLLTPLVGDGNVRATVTANVDFTVNEQTQELFDADPTQIRSEQTQDQSTQEGAAVGIPGALTNQPPAAGQVEAEAAQEADGGEALNSSRSATRNYELDKTITHMRKAPGTIQQVSAAVIIDDRKSTNEEGEVVRTPLTAEEIERFTALVKEAVGFNEGRGDSVIVLNQSFQPPQEIEPVAPLPIWEQPWVWNAGRQVIAGLAVLLLILMVVRPAMRNLKRTDVQQIAHTTNAEGKAVEVQVDGETGTVNASATPGLTHENATLEPPQQVYGDILNLARAMADEDPKRVAKVVKDWVGSTDE
jgi:flagellar M-ring protein FliF